MVTAKQRQQNKTGAAAFKARMAEQGLVQANFWVPASAVAELRRACELLRADPDLDVARLVSKTTGRLRGLKAPPKA